MGGCMGMGCTCKGMYVQGDVRVWDCVCDIGENRHGCVLLFTYPLFTRPLFLVCTPPHIPPSTHPLPHIPPSPPSPPQQRILRCDYQVPSTIQLSAECLDLLSKLLVVDPNQRYTVPQIQAHPWYQLYLPAGVADMNKNLEPNKSVQV